MLDNNDFPLTMFQVWEWFLELSATRQFNEHGALPFTYQEIKSWSDLTGNKPSHNDIKTLKKLDNVYLKTTRKKDK